METVVVGLVMLVGLVGVVVPLLPGTALVLAAGIGWAVLVVPGGSGRWVVVAVMAVLFAVGVVLKYALAGRRMSADLPRSTLLVAGAGAVLGFFVLPPFGVLFGGVLGTYLAEARRVGSGGPAWASTVRVLQAVGIGLLAELSAGLLMVATWLVGLVLT